MPGRVSRPRVRVPGVGKGLPQLLEGSGVAGSGGGRASTVVRECSLPARPASALLWGWGNRQEPARCFCRHNPRPGADRSLEVTAVAQAQAGRRPLSGSGGSCGASGRERAGGSAADSLPAVGHWLRGLRCSLDPLRHRGAAAAGQCHGRGRTRPQLGAPTAPLLLPGPAERLEGQHPAPSALHPAPAPRRRRLGAFPALRFTAPAAAGP